MPCAKFSVAPAVLMNFFYVVRPFSLLSVLREMFDSSVQMKKVGEVNNDVTLI